MIDKEHEEALGEVFDLSEQLSLVMDSKDLFIILMALAKVSGMMLVEANGMAPDFDTKDSSIKWLTEGISAAYSDYQRILSMADDQLH